MKCYKNGLHWKGKSIYEKNFYITVRFTIHLVSFISVLPTLLSCDVLARYKRLMGYDVFIWLWSWWAWQEPSAKSRKKASHTSLCWYYSELVLRQRPWYLMFIHYHEWLPPENHLWTHCYSEYYCRWILWLAFSIPDEEFFTNNCRFSGEQAGNVTGGIIPSGLSWIGQEESVVLISK